jgi:hypothetical protein
VEAGKELDDVLRDAKRGFVEWLVGELMKW